MVDPFRPGHELAYHPGEMNLRRADVIVVNKVSTAPPENVERVVANVRAVNPTATVIRADSVITVTEGERMRGQAGAGGRGRSHAHPRGHGHRGRGGGGASLGAAEVVDPRPYAVGELRRVFDA